MADGGRVISFTVITAELAQILVRKAGLGHANCHGGAPDVWYLVNQQ